MSAGSNPWGYLTENVIIVKKQTMYLMKSFKAYLSLLVLPILFSIQTFAQNPLIRNMYSADPSARVFGDSVYVYPSHDILATPGHGRVGWFCMEDYHVFSSANLTNWKDDGVVVS